MEFNFWFFLKYSLLKPSTIDIRSGHLTAAFHLLWITDTHNSMMRNLCDVYLNKCIAKLHINKWYGTGSRFEVQSINSHSKDNFNDSLPAEYCKNFYIIRWWNREIWPFCQKGKWKWILHKWTFFLKPSRLTDFFQLL